MSVMKETAGVHRAVLDPFQIDHVGREVEGGVSV